MRIPTQFNEDNLYRRRQRRQESTGTQRRLVRLILALGLVIIVMRQASSPTIYQPFFGAPSAEPVAASEGQGTPIANGAWVDPASSREDRRVAYGLLDGLAPADERQWASAFSARKAGKPNQQIPSTLPRLRDRLEQLESVSALDRLRWGQLFDAVQSSDPPTPSEDALLSASLTVLEQAATSRVVDGSVWRSADFDAFYLYLDQAESLTTSEATTSAIVPLLQQPDVFRGQPIRFRGTVARRERLPSTDNPFGIEHYWQLWLRPTEGADRPLVAIVRSLPTSRSARGDVDGTEEETKVTVVGRYLKRLAYQSSLGADLAPVLVGRIVIAPVVSTPQQQATTPDTNQLWVVIPIACVLGLAIAIWAVWSTNRMSRSVRRLRAARRNPPDEFLNELRQGSPLPSRKEP